MAWLTWGIGVFNQGVFLGFFVAEYGWSRSALSFGPTLFYLWAGVIGLVVGRLIDRRGSRPVLIVGAVTLGCGTIALGLTRQVWQVYPAFLLLGTGYAFLHTVTLGAIVAGWFVRERARAMAVVTLGGSFGGMVLPPLNATLLERWGGLTSGLTLAALAGVIVVPLAIWVVRDGPAGRGPRAAPGQGSEKARPASSPVDDAVWTVRAALRTSSFWAIAISFHLVMIAQAGFLIHQVPFLQTRFGLLGATTIVTLSAGMGALGRVALVLIGHRWSSRRVAVGTCLLQAAGLLLSAVGGADWILIVGSVLFGFTPGISIALQPVMAVECFGARSFGRIYGLIYQAIQFGSALGPLLIGLLATAAGSYRPALILVAAGPLLATLLIRWATPPVLAIHRHA